VTESGLHHVPDDEGTDDLQGSFGRPFSFPSEEHLSLTEGAVCTACPLCNRSLSSTGLHPLALVCGHSLCNECCEAMREGINVECPACRSLTQPKDLKTNYALGGLHKIPIAGIGRRSTIAVLDDIGAACLVCMEVFSAAAPPHLLACGHSVCEGCCHRGIKTCPLCQAPMEELGVNKPLAKFVEALVAFKRRDVSEPSFP